MVTIGKNIMGDTLTGTSTRFTQLRHHQDDTNLYLTWWYFDKLGCPSVVSQNEITYSLDALVMRDILSISKHKLFNFVSGSLHSYFNMFMASTFIPSTCWWCLSWGKYKVDVGLDRTFSKIYQRCSLSEVPQNKKIHGNGN